MLDARKLSPTLLLIALLVGGATTLLWARDNDAAIQSLYSKAQFAKSRGDLPEAIREYQAILIRDPHSAPAYNNLGLLYFQQHDYPQAAKSFETALHYGGAISSPLVPLGVAYYKMAEYEKAKPVLARAVRLRPTDKLAALYLGRTLFDAGNKEEALSVLQKLVQQHPKYQGALYSLGQMYMELAQTTLGRLYTLAPNSFQTHLIKARVMEATQNYRGALMEYQKAEAQNPSAGVVHYYIGNVYWLEGKWNKAKAEFKQDLAVDPYNCLALWKVGNILVKTHTNRRAALLYLQKALRVCPNLSQAILDYGKLLDEEGNYEKAIRQFDRVAQLSPKEPSVHFMLGTAYQKLGRSNEAKREFKIFQELQQKAHRTVASEPSE